MIPGFINFMLILRLANRMERKWKLTLENWRSCGMILIKVLSCCCGDPECAAMVKYEKKEEKIRVHQFLMGLDSSRFGITRSNLLSRQTRDVWLQQQLANHSRRTPSECYATRREDAGPWYDCNNNSTFLDYDECSSCSSEICTKQLCLFTLWKARTWS